MRRPGWTDLTTGACALTLGLAGCGGGEDAGAAAAPANTIRPDEYVVPGDRVFPEGIAVDRSTGRVYVGSTTDGTVYRSEGPGSPLRPFLLAGRDGRTAATGLEVDDRGRLFVAGRGTARAFVYEAATGRLVRALRAPGRGRSLVNDITVTPAAAYITDSIRPVLYRSRFDGARIGELEAWLDLTRTPIPTSAAFNLNGIVAGAGGRYLVTVHFETGRLFRIDTRTRRVREVDLAGARLRTGDGMVLEGRTLLVVREEPGDIVPVRLADDLLSGRVGTAFGRDRLRFPTTAAVRDDRLLVVNSQLDRAPDRARLPFTITALRPPAGVLGATGD